MKSPAPTPNWKHIILSTPDWPKELTIPQQEDLPEDSEAIRSSTSTDETWQWELWRHPDGHCYYLKVWLREEADLENPGTPGAALSVKEAFQFLVSNWMPRDVIADLLFEHPEMVEVLAVPPAADLN